MNEQDLKKMFDFFVSEGYDMGDWKTFPKDMGDDKKRKTMYDFFRAEGYDLGDFDTFKYTDQTTQQSEQRTAAQKAAVTGAKKDPISAALQEASTRMQEYDEGLAKTLEANAKNIQAISQNPKTTKEQRALFEGIPGLEHLTKEPKWGDTPVVDAFIQKNFANATPELKDNLTANLMSMGEQQFKELMSSDLNERRKAQLLVESTQKKAQQIAVDLNINKGRAKNLDKYTALLQAKNYLEQQAPSEEINQSKAQVESELANFEGSPEQETLKLQGQYEQQRQQLENVYKLHPQEALRLQKVEERKKAVTIQPGDSVGTQIKKQFKATLNEIPNSVIRGAVNLMEVAKQLSDATQEIAGVDTDYQAPSDKAIEALSDFAEDFSQSAFPTLDKAVFEGGDINGEAVLPAISRTLSDMAVLLFGAKGLGGGKAGLVLSSLAQTAPDYYYAAKEKGLNNQQALAYAQAQALGQGLLELVNPGSAGQLIAGASSKSLTKLIEKAGQRKLTLADISHHVFNEIAGENAQEMLQMASEKLGQYVSDLALETDFKPEFNKDEVYETLFLTSIVSGLSAGAGLKAASKVRRQEAITKLAELDNVPQILNNMVQAGTLDIAEAQTVLEEVQAKKEELTPEKLVEAAPEVVDAIAEEDIPTLEEATAALNDALQPKANQKDEAQPKGEAPKAESRAEPNEVKSEPPAKPTKLVNPKKVEVGDIVEYEGITYEVSRKKPNGSFDLIEPGNPQAGARGVFPNELYVKAETEPTPEGEQTTATQAQAEGEVQKLPKRVVPSSNPAIKDNVEVDEDTYQKWKEIDDKEKQTIENEKNSQKSAERKAANIKGYTKQFAAEKRKVLNTLTQQEHTAEEKKASTLHNNDVVMADGKAGKIVSFPFGKVKIQTKDGSTFTTTKDKVTKTTNRDIVATKLKEAFNLSQEEAKATMSIYDAVANSWAKRTGKSSEDWYDRLDVKKGTEEDLKRLKKKAGVLFQTYESNIKSVLDKTKLKAGTPQQWSKEFQTLKGTNQEVDAIGLEEYMKDYMDVTGAKSVPKEEIEKYLAINQIPLEDIVLGDKTPTEYHYYKEPGGEDYREMLITMPGGDFKSGHWTPQGVVAHTRFDTRTNEAGEKVLFVEEVQSDWAQELRRKGARKLSAQQLKDQIKNVEKAKAKAQQSFDDNVAKARVEHKNLIKNGEISEEVPGLAEERRAKYGFREGELDSRVRTGFDWLTDSLLQFAKDNNATDLVKYLEDVRKANDDINRLGLRLSELRQQVSAPSNMPWSNTDQWAGLTARRLIQYAAQNGFDRIAWTTGQQQNERYSLSQYADSISYRRYSNGTYDIELSGDGQELELETKTKNLTRDELVGLVGESVAKQIDAHADSISYPGEQVDSSIDTDNIEIGGEGMRSFYDKILPTIFKKEARRFDKKATVETTKVDTGQMPDIEYPSMQEVKEKAEAEGYSIVSVEELLDTLKPESDLYKMALSSAAGSDLRVQYRTGKVKSKTKTKLIEELRENYIGRGDNQQRRENIRIIKALEQDLINIDTGNTLQQSIKITDDLKKVTEVPLFQGEQAAVEKTKEGTIIYALTDPNVSSPVHELAHIFERELTDRQRKIVKEWAGDKKWTRDTSEKFARGFEKYLAEGKAPSIKLKNVFEQFKNWLKDIYKGLITYKGKEIVLNDKMRALYDEILTGEDYVENMKALEDQGVLFQTDEPLFSKFFDQVKKYTEAYKKKYPAKDFEQFKKDFPLKKVKEDTLRDAWEGREPQSKTKAKEAELGEQGTRQREGKFAKRASEDSRLLDEVKNEIKENSLNYFTQPNRVTEAAAEYALDQFESDEKAADALMSKDFNHLDGAVKVMLGQKLILRLNESAKNSDNPKKLLEKAADVADFTVDFGREAGRAVQAFRAWSMMSPEGIILWANKQSSKTRTGLLQSHAQDIDLAVEGFRRAENAAKELALKIRPPEPVKLFGYTKEDLKKKKQEAWAKFKKFTGLSASLTGLTKEQIEAIGEYGFYSFVDGLRTIKGWAKNIQKKFGVDDTVTNHIWSNLQTPLGKTLQDLSNVTISDLSIGKKELAEEIKNTFNVTEKEAQAFADQLNKVYNDELQRQARKQARSAISRKGAYGKVGNAIARAVENNNLTRKGIEEALLKEYNHQNLTKEDIDYLEEKAKEMQALPEGFLKDKRVMELMNYLQDKNGESKAWDVATSLWYASILSGPATQMVNITANAVNVGLETFITTLEKLIQGDPASAALAWYGLFTGMKQGWSEAATILAEGAPPNKRSSKFFEANSLERFKLDKNKSLKENIKALVPAIAKYVPRAMSAADTFFYYMAFESAANAYAISLANRKIGLSTKEKNQLVLDMIKGTISLDDAKIQARKELAEAAQKLGKPVESLATNREIKKRAYEIVTESRAAKDFHFIELADKYAAFGTFNYKPQGLLGLFANKISETTSKVPALKLIVPFTNIVANVLNQQLDYTPVGVYRWAANAYNFSNTKLEPFATGDRQLDDRRLIKGLFGTAGLVALFALCLKGIDDEDEAEFPYFTISGAGPRGKQDSYAKKNQLYERGWKPYSIKIGDKWISYQYFPVAAVLTIYGNVHDSYKYDKAEPEKLIPSIVTAMEQIAPAILNMSFLSGLAELFEGLTDEKASESYFKRFGSKTVTSVFPSLLKTIDSAFDPTVYEARTFKERVIKGTPFVKIGLKPQLNTFGEPIKKKPVPLLGSPAVGTMLGAERFTSVMKTDDPVVALFADKGEFAPVIGRSITYDKVKLTDDQYYDYCEMVGKIFKKRIAEQLDYYKGLDGNETLTWAGKPYTQFGKEIKQLHNEIRDQVKSDMFAYGMSKQEILKQNGL